MSCCPCSKLELTPRRDKTREREAKEERDEEDEKEGRGIDEKLASPGRATLEAKELGGGGGTRAKRNGKDDGDDEVGGGRWGTERIANASHINKRGDTVCEAAEKPPSLQPPPEIAGFEHSRNLLKIHRPAPNGAFGWAVEG